MKAQLTPYLMSKDARKQAEAYVQALGGEILVVRTYGDNPGAPEEQKDKVMHLALKVGGDNMLFLADSPESVVPSRIVSLSLSFDNEADARQAYDGLSAGGTAKYPFTLQPWGFYGELEDQFGINWMIVKQ